MGEEVGGDWAVRLGGWRWDGLGLDWVGAEVFAMALAGNPFLGGSFSVVRGCGDGGCVPDGMMWVMFCFVAHGVWCTIFGLQGVVRLGGGSARGNRLCGFSVGGLGVGRPTGTYSGMDKTRGADN